MSETPDAPSLLRRARQIAGLSQRALAWRAGTSQSVIARIELGETDPGFQTLTRLIRAAGCEFDVTIISPLDRKIELDSSYLENVRWAEARPENQSGVDKTWVGKLLDAIRDHYDQAVRVRR